MYLSSRGLGKRCFRCSSGAEAQQSQSGQVSYQMKKGERGFEHSRRGCSH
jgi:hypothetical protein